MNDIAIRVQGIGKRYRIGTPQEKYRTFRDSVSSALTMPVRAIRSLSQRNGHSKRSESIWALKDVSFEIKRGEVVGVIGRNGAGKSTLLKILSRITDPTEGLADIHGRVGSLLEVGTGFHPELTGRENTYLNGAILGMGRKEIDEKFDEIVAFAEIEKFIDTPVKHYSSGMYLRLAFAVAAHLETEILLVDEVLAVGDIVFQKKCLGKMGEVAKQGRTVMFVSHNIAAVSSLTKRSILLNGGQVEVDDATEKVIRAYISHSGMLGGEVVRDKSALGDESFEFTSFHVGSEERTTTFSSDTEINITLNYEIKKPLYGLRVGFDLLSDDGVIVLRTYPDDLVTEIEEQAAGSYSSVCKIPANLLNQGNYFITLRASIHAVKYICLLDKALSFTVINVNGSNARYGGKRPGVINPSLVWQTSKSDELIKCSQ